MYISLYDLGAVIIFTIIVIVSVYLIAVLRRIFCILGYIRDIFKDHNYDMGQIISALPAIAANMNELIISLKGIADHTNNTFGSLQDNLTDTVDDLRDGLDNVVIYAKVIGEVCRAVFSKSE